MPLWLGVIPISIGVVVFMGTAVVYLRGAADKSDVERLERSNETLVQSNEALLQRVRVVEAAALAADAQRAKDQAASEAERARLTTRVSMLERENTSLLAQRPSAEVLVQMREDLVQIKAVMTAIASLMKDSA